VAVAFGLSGAADEMQCPGVGCRTIPVASREAPCSGPGCLVTQHISTENVISCKKTAEESLTPCVGPGCRKATS
jgi:hypothetical protein